MGLTYQALADPGADTEYVEEIVMMHGQVHKCDQEQTHSVAHPLCRGLLGVVEETDHVTQQHGFTDLARGLEQTTDARHACVQTETAPEDLVQVGPTRLLAKGGSLFGLDFAGPFLEHQIG